MSSKKTINDKHLPWPNPTKATFLLGCIAGAVITTAFSIFGTYLSSSNNNDNSDNNNIKNIIDNNNEKIQEIEEKKQIETVIQQNTENTENTENKSVKSLLLNDRVYERLQLETKAKNNFYYQYVPDPQISYVLAINILIEYLPNSIIQILFTYLPKKQSFNICNYLKNGWTENKNIIHDYPLISVENVLPISNQPSLIITVGLPGSGKTTWAKIRINKQKQNVIAADDYFDKYNNGNFNPSLLSKAHEWAQLNIDNALKCGYNVVANNTNTTLPEMHAYVTKVIFGDLPHKIIFAVMPETNISILTKRGIHGVAPKKCKEMLKRMNFWLQKGPPSINRVLKAGAFKRYYSKTTLSKDVLYTAIFANQEIQNKIRRYFISMSGKPLLPNITDCHLTLKFKPSCIDIDQLPFGRKVNLKIIGYAIHEYVQCFIVDIMDDLIRKLCTNKYPHITISFNKHKVRPNYSNDLLINGKVIPIINNFDIENSRNYNKLYRNINNQIGGGLIFEGIIGGFYKNPNGGVYLKRPKQIQQQQQQPQQQQEYDESNITNKPGKKRRRRGGRNRNKNKDKD